MRILVVTSTFPRWPGDTEPGFVFELCRRLQTRGVAVDVIAPHAPGAKRSELMDGIHVHRYRYGPERLEILAYQGGILANIGRYGFGIFMVPLLLLSQAIAVWGRVHGSRYDLVHAHWLIPQGLVCVFINLLRGRQHKIPVVCTAHGGDLYALRGRLMGMVKYFVMRRLTHLAVVSSAMQKTCLAMGVRRERVSVLPMGVDLEYQFNPAPQVRRHDTRLIYVGRLVEKKGVRYLIEAMAIIRKAVPAIELLLVGEGPLGPVIRQQIAQLKLESNVRLLGSLSNADLPPLYSSAAVCVVPSIVDRSGDQEGLGLILVEALGCGCAVVASDLPAIHDVVQHGHTGLLARAADAGDIADKVLQLLRDQPLRERLAANGRESVRARFDWETAASGYYQLFHGLVAEETGNNRQKTSSP